MTNNDPSSHQTETYMIIGNCQTIQPVRYLLCTKLCPMGTTNKPTSVDIRPERLICEGQIQIKAVSVTLECGCVENEPVSSDPLALLLDG